MSLVFRQCLQRGAFNLDAEGRFPPGVNAIFGESGSGKSSLLRALAGLEAGRGQIQHLGRDLQSLPSHRRGLGLLTQRAALLPHLNVGENLKLAHRLGPAGLNPAQIEDLIKQLDLCALIERRPLQLSGGEQQRVALARCLIGGARLLLLDEPCSGLDHASHERFLKHLSACTHKLGLTVLLVTHHLWEAARTADHACLMQNGKLGAIQPINQLLCSADLATRRDAMACLQLPVLGFDHSDHILSLELGRQVLQVACGEPGEREQRVLIPAASVSLSPLPPQHSSALNRIETQFLSAYPSAPGELTAVLRTGDHALLARITARSLRQLNLASGDRLYAQIKATALH